MKLRRIQPPWPTHAPACVLTLTLAVGLGAFAASFVRVAGWSPLRLTSRLVLEPLPPTDWNVEWTSAAVTAHAQQNAAFDELGLVVLVLSLVGALVALISFVALALGAASTRRSELAVREAMGATPLALGGRLLLHAMTMGAVALIAGALAASVAVTFAERSWPHALLEASYNEKLLRAFGAGSLIAVTAVVLSSVLAYLAVVRRPLAAVLTSGTRVTASPGELQLRNALAVVQFAGVLALLSGAAILARESRPELAVTTAERASLMIARLQLNGSNFREPQNRVRFINALRERVRSLPGVKAATLASTGAWLGVGPLDRVTVECGECYRAYMYMPYDSPYIRLFAIMPDFFDVLAINIEDGRAIEPADAASGKRVALVNRALASAHFEGEKPIGRHAQIPTPQHEIVGIVPAIVAPVLGGPRPLDFSMYLSVLQYPPRTLDLLVRVDDVEAASDALSRLRAQLPAGVVLHEPQTADAALRELGAPLRFLTARLLGITLLVVLAGVHGAYALQRFRVENQRRELSVRLAVGSTPRSLTRHVLVQTVRVVRNATVVGIFGALASARGVQMLIPGAPPFAPGVFTAITLLLLGAALLGSLLPAVRAARLDPAAVLD